MILNTLQSKSEKEIIDTLGKLSPNDMLIKSCCYGFLYGVKQALDNGTDPSVNNNLAIQWAANNGHKEVVELLLNDSRVDPSVDNNVAIRSASYHGHKEVLIILLKDSRVDPSANNLAFQIALNYGHNEILDLLIKDERV